MDYFRFYDLLMMANLDQFHKLVTKKLLHFRILQNDQFMMKLSHIYAINHIYIIYLLERSCENSHVYNIINGGI